METFKPVMKPPKLDQIDENSSSPAFKRSKVAL